MTKNLTLGPILAQLIEIWVPTFIFGFYSTSSWTLFQAIIQWIKLEKMTKNLILAQFWLVGPKYDPSPPFKNCFYGFYLYQQLDIVLSYHLIQFKGKLMIQTSENGKKSNLGPDFGPLWPKFGHQNFFFVFFSSTIFYTLLQTIIACNFKDK